MRTRVVNCKKEEYDIYIGRPSKWGNPFSHIENSRALIIVDSREEAVRRYRAWLMAQPELVEKARQELRGKVLGCWCFPKPCHGEVLAEIADQESELERHERCEKELAETDWDSFDELWADMKSYANDNPDYDFLCADNAEFRRFGWIACHGDDFRMWTIKLSNCREAGLMSRDRQGMLRQLRED